MLAEVLRKIEEHALHSKQQGINFGELTALFILNLIEVAVVCLGGRLSLGSRKFAYQEMSKLIAPVFSMLWLFNILGS